MPLQAEYTQKTSRAYIATRVLDTPFWALYNMLPIIVYKELHASPLQLAAMIALKPVVSLLSMYWSSSINKRRDRLVMNIVSARFLAYLPFLFFPFIDLIWFFILAFGSYMMLAIGTTPAWVEILKLNIPKNSREQLFSYTQAFGYMGGGLLPFGLGWLLDGYEQAWRWLFAAAASTALLAYFLQRRILIPPCMIQQEKLKALQLSNQQSHLWHNLKALIANPWKNGWMLLVENRPFRWFQIGIALVGSALMVIQPALPIFFIDTLNLSYTEVTIALTLCKGIGFGIASPFWSRWIHRINIFHLSSVVAICGCLFPLCLLLAPEHLIWLYSGYVAYGIMQSGNELLWNMSGPIFSKEEEDSSVYTSVNVVSTGLRGCFIPIIGSYLCFYIAPTAVFGLATSLYLLAAAWLWQARQRLHLAGTTASVS